MSGTRGGRGEGRGELGDVPVRTSSSFPHHDGDTNLIGVSLIVLSPVGVVEWLADSRRESQGSLKPYAQWRGHRCVFFCALSSFLSPLSSSAMRQGGLERGGAARKKHRGPTLGRRRPASAVAGGRGERAFGQAEVLLLRLGSPISCRARVQAPCLSSPWEGAERC